MTAEREALADRVRAALPHDRPVREVSMFGGLSFMVDDSMVVAVGREGDLLVRIDPARNDELLTVPGAKPAVMGPTAQWDRAGSPSLPMASPPTSNSPSGSKSVWSTEPHGQRAITDRGPGSDRAGLRAVVSFTSGALKRPIMPLTGRPPTYDHA